MLRIERTTSHRWCFHIHLPGQGAWQVEAVSRRNTQSLCEHLPWSAELPATSSTMYSHLRRRRQIPLEAGWQKPFMFQDKKVQAFNRIRTTRKYWCKNLNRQNCALTWLPFRPRRARDVVPRQPSHRLMTRLEGCTLDPVAQLYFWPSIVTTGVFEVISSYT